MRTANQYQKINESWFYKMSNKIMLSHAKEKKA